MRLTDFSYELPTKLIAQFPPPQRGDSRLMILNGAAGKVEHLHFLNLIDLLNPEDLLVFNDTRVLPARLFGHKQTGGQIEVMLERILSEKTVLAKIRSNKAPRQGQQLILEGGMRAQVLTREGEFFKLRLQISEDSIVAALEQYGHIPLPPYIKRRDEDEDKERYQTVFAKNSGAVAAPTAGLHFTHNFFEQLEQKSIAYGFVTLHVGSGTFQPIRCENLDEHVMHSEFVQVSQSLIDQIRICKKQGGRIIAVGTTVVRSLETAVKNGEIEAFEGDSQLFLKPGVSFKVVDAMITNFHLPRSTLLMLVCAFAGSDLTLQAYAQAVNENYRFFSYGDAMLVIPNRAAWDI